VSHGNASLALGYAQAIYELALEAWQKRLTVVRDNLAANPSLGPTLDDKNIPFETRRQQLDDVLPADISAQERNFFYTLLKEGNLHLLEDVSNHLMMLVARGANIQEAVVTTAVSLDDAEKEQFRLKLTAKYGDNLQLRFKVDPKIVGGVVVQVGDKILDGSVSAKLNAAQNILKTVL